MGFNSGFKGLKHKRNDSYIFINEVKSHSALCLYLADVTPYQLVIASHISTLDILVELQWNIA